jgi:hypothetical protein
METNQNPSRLVIPSHLSAERSVQAWMQQNRLDVVKDAAGLEWRIVVDMREIPDAVDHRRAVVELTVRVQTTASASDLVATGTLMATADERLVQLLGDARVPFSRKPLYHEAKSMDEARRWLADRMTEIGDEMRSSPFHDVKRNLLGRWIDARGEFGYGVISQSKQ